MLAHLPSLVGTHAGQHTQCQQQRLILLDLFFQPGIVNLQSTKQSCGTLDNNHLSGKAQRDTLLVTTRTRS